MTGSAPNSDDMTVIAQRFLQTAVIVDDEAFMGGSRPMPDNQTLREPDRQSMSISHRKAVDPEPGGRTKSLDAEVLIGAFSKIGIICGVTGPENADLTMLRKADMLILDWRMGEDSPQTTLKLLRNVLTGDDDRNALRLIAVYTGEATLTEISDHIFRQLQELELSPERAERDCNISYNHGQIVIYAKSNVNLADSEALAGRSVEESRLPKRLLEDFADMTSGLLPTIAITSLTAVREGSHKILDQFKARLDPAFLTHRACLLDPEMAGLHMATAVAEELRGLIENAVVQNSPGGADAAQAWVQRNCSEDMTLQRGGIPGKSRTITKDKAISLVRVGANAILSGKNWRSALTSGLIGKKSEELDLELAWMMSFRTVFEKPAPVLWLGTVLSETQGNGEHHMLCMRPRCDCVRLAKDTKFMFLPLLSPEAAKGGKPQIVVKLDDNHFERMGIDFDCGHVIFREFCPRDPPGPVNAVKGTGGDGYRFDDKTGTS